PHKDTPGGAPPAEREETAKDATLPDPASEAIAALEAGATTEEALDAYDRAAAALLAPDAAAVRAERIAAELAAAAKEGKEA
ncbi:MAG: hypothetical protein GX748_10135, partial [Lentisphaerae bacterium]|nr:hypothetical protein [Lentisphaerota bacterium]